jgi:hypothetical protein
MMARGMCNVEISRDFRNPVIVKGGLKRQRKKLIQ